MKIHSLGHSCFILEMAPDGGGEPVRILFDPWLSDYSVGDLMGRFPRVRFEPADLAPIHAIYLTHGHTDHFDPETLLRLWHGLDPKPDLLVPETIACLAPLLREHLPGAEPTVVRAGADLAFRGLTLAVFCTWAERVTNEDDVMVLVVRNGRESFLNECDCILPLGEVYGRVVVQLELGLDRNEQDPPETACFLTTRNELAATMSMIAAESAEEREWRAEEGLIEIVEEIHDLYAPFSAEKDDYGNDKLWSSPRLVRLIGGQGLCHPQELDADRNRTLFPFRVPDRVRFERETAEGYGCRHSIEELRAGETHVLEGGRLVERRRFEPIEMLDRAEDRAFDPKLPLSEEFPDAPLKRDVRDEERQLRLIREALDLRFLPFLNSLSAAGILDVLSGEEEYRIRFLFVEGPPRELRLSLDTMRFVEVDPADDPDEVYWANDIEDFLDGRCDEFSRYCRKPPGGRTQRFWRCLGLPFLNHDLVEKKHRLHFERAARGETNRGWVLPFHA